MSQKDEGINIERSNIWKSEAKTNVVMTPIDGKIVRYVRPTNEGQNQEKK